MSQGFRGTVEAAINGGELSIRGLLSSYFPWVLLVVFYAGASVFLPSLMTGAQINLLLVQSTPVILLGVGLTFCLATAEFDLSIVGLVSFAPLVGLLAWQNLGIPPVLALVVIGGVGLVVGLFNGLVVTNIGIPSLISTLAMWWVLQGAVLSLTGGRTFAAFPELYSQIGIGSVGPIRYLVIIALALTIIAWFFSVKVPAGRRIFLVGGDPGAAERMGIDIDRYKIYAFMISGLFASIAGVLLVSRVGSLSSGTGSELLMPAIAAPVIAGVSLFGGTGKVINVLAGAILVRALLQITRVAGVSGTNFQLVQGLLIFVVVILMESQIRAVILGDRVSN